MEGFQGCSEPFIPRQSLKSRIRGQRSSILPMIGRPARFFRFVENALCVCLCLSLRVTHCIHALYTLLSACLTFVSVHHGIVAVRQRNYGRLPSQHLQGLNLGFAWASAVLKDAKMNTINRFYQLPLSFTKIIGQV